MGYAATARRQPVTSVLLPGSGDYYVFDDKTVLFLHYAGTGTNASVEVTEDPEITRTCRTAFETVWELAVPAGDYSPA